MNIPIAIAGQKWKGRVKIMDKERQKLLNAADTLKGNINRMCVTDDVEELSRQHKAAMRGLHEIFLMRLFDITGEGGEI